MHGSLGGTPPDLTYTPEPGYVGPDSFTFVVADCGLESAPATVTVEVVAADRTPPVVTCPADLALEATGPDGAPASWPAVTAIDETDDQPRDRHHPEPGSVFPLGTTEVTGTGTDAAGNGGDLQLPGDGPGHHASHRRLSPSRRGDHDGSVGDDRCSSRLQAPRTR